ncbi:xanthine dehydrogenase accessory protein XdhC [Salinicola avicenniae]|uniref:xanthine dehydrogenase accessory protein XdhC n=1 Tax=Salinicola avicenniae TaxID=2916836 RepID=UPI00207348B5|nr:MULTISPECIES: xanthine dehydrogenase accessory protein XdhC [unclassified Salinicola]
MSANATGETWHAALHRLQQAGEPHALATVVGAAGSTPREPGARLVITRTTVADTLGGGHFEQQIIDLARERLTGEPIAAGVQLEAFPLGGRSGQCCGGFVHVLLEVFPGAEQRLALFGAGHVGQALVALLRPLPWRIDWFDTRDEAFASAEALPERIRPRRWRHDADSLADTIAAVAPGSHVCVMTHDHAQDRDLIAALIARDDLASLGLIGSDSKWASFRRRLRETGASEPALARVRCPIGIAGAHGKRPQEIAISVAAELFTLCRETPRAPRGDDAALADRRGVPPARLRDAFVPLPPTSPAAASDTTDVDRCHHPRHRDLP